MKLAVGILALLLVLAGLLAVPLIAHRARAWPDCISHVVIVRGRNGGPVECVCLDGTLSTCFDPGPEGDAPARTRKPRGRSVSGAPLRP